jgi:hypothetical protein
VFLGQHLCQVWWRSGFGVIVPQLALLLLSKAQEADGGERPTGANDSSLMCCVREFDKEGNRMLMNFFAGLFHKRCPLCKQEVQVQGNAVVQRFGKWFCSELHADLYELDLYEALQTVHCHHATCHGEYVPLPEAVGMDLSPGHNRELAHLVHAHERCLARLL